MKSTKENEAKVSTDDAAMRVHALKLAQELVLPTFHKVFNIGKVDVELNVVKQLYEFAEYNYRFLMKKDLEIEYKSNREKISAQFSEANRKFR
jgi:hypothetical protein